MKKTAFVPLAKQSKKARKTWFQAKRGSWGAVSPVTRVMKSAKASGRADRRRQEREAAREADRP